MEKYKTHQVITEENEQYGGNLKENTLRNKFLTSIILQKNGNLSEITN